MTRFGINTNAFFQETINSEQEPKTALKVKMVEFHLPERWPQGRVELRRSTCVVTQLQVGCVPVRVSMVGLILERGQRLREGTSGALWKLRYTL
ncbi:hypothetical protein Zmor_013587 [Zophobas morio]|uniref:Uncharacterized protein n=1 Tax=Zophobas morio TaxID=2755281 RepID=A0AA38MF88_9CUCU|nr:hypothetical protein Zmor_013587 [Zophobas morio]